MREFPKEFRPSSIVRYAGAALFGFIALSQWLGVLLALSVTEGPRDLGVLIPLAFGSVGTGLFVRWWQIGASIEENQVSIRRLFRTRRFRYEDIGGIGLTTTMTYGEDPQFVDVYAVFDRDGKPLCRIDTIRLLRNFDELIATVNAAVARSR